MLGSVEKNDGQGREKKGLYIVDEASVPRPTS